MKPLYTINTYTYFILIVLSLNKSYDTKVTFIALQALYFFDMFLKNVSKKI